MCVINKPIIDVEATAANLKALRIKSGLSVKQIQAVFNFSYPQAIYNWESGKDVPTVDNLIVLAAVYCVPIEKLVLTKTVQIECSLDNGIIPGTIHAA